PGRPSTHLLDLIDEQLKTALLGALQHADKQRQPVRLEGVSAGDEQYRLTVEPLMDGRSSLPHFLVKLESLGAAAPVGETLELAGQQRDYVNALESELRFAKETLQATI